MSDNGTGGAKYRDMSNSISNPEMGYRDVLSLTKHEPGDLVRVLPAYRGAGTFSPDGSEGVYAVIRSIGGAPEDYKLAHVPRNLTEAGARTWAKEHGPEASWDRIMCASRIEPIEAFK